jgi:hypothetical protein
MTLTVQDLVTEFDELNNEAIVQVQYKGVDFNIDKIEECDTGRAILHIGLDSQILKGSEDKNLTISGYPSKNEESEDEESEE